jgi:hypothetical protein
VAVVKALDVHCVKKILIHCIAFIGNNVTVTFLRSNVFIILCYNFPMGTGSSFTGGKADGA